MIKIEIPLKPYAQERPRFARVGNFVKTYDDTKSKSWKAAARIYMKAATRGVETPLFTKDVIVGVRLRFFFELPTSARRKTMEVPAQWHKGRMDFDNLAKCVCDAATGILWADDRQVAYGTVEKIRSAQDSPRKWGVEIEAWELEQYPGTGEA